ncbi:NAD(P)-dependent oxidoreductase [Alcanivorax sp. JB21]|uniref:NAD(P)-dependent oxidoreductase n=1 Tax=Alcanivorax limicola TaxID=2874102 RepID=UPI001CBE618E|nr:NAD(P)-dependent oxidoreductase [Alcanivorax limicola]MBZ2187623.1 NAD(P)-dependent oxidoreductase [Alcanivorax limicola]
MSMNIGFIGLGVMGYPMAGHLQRAGHSVCVYNRTTLKAERWVDRFGGIFVSTPAEAAVGADLVITCVGNDDDLRSVIEGPAGALCGMHPGALLVDHTTASADVTRELAALARANRNDWLDAPVSGGQQGAENGTLTIMCGGSRENFELASPALRCYARALQLMGDTGAGQLTKMVNQICVAGVVQGLAEGMAFAESAGLDPHQVIEAISQGAAGSWQMTHRHDTMIKGEYDHGFAVNWMRKDLDICLREAADNGCELPLTELVNEFYREIQQMGGGRWDTSSLLKRLQARRVRH